MFFFSKRLHELDKKRNRFTIGTVMDAFILGHWEIKLTDTKTICTNERSHYFMAR